MPNNLSPRPRLTLTMPAEYLIRFRGQVDQNWIEYFDRLFSGRLSVPWPRAGNDLARSGARSSRAAGDIALSVPTREHAGLGRMPWRVSACQLCDSRHFSHAAVRRNLRRYQPLFLKYRSIALALLFVFVLGACASPTPTRPAEVYRPKRLPLFHQGAAYAGRR